MLENTNDTLQADGSVVKENYTSRTEGYKLQQLIHPSLRI